jgi:hypothetical protein
VVAIQTVAAPTRTEWKNALLMLMGRNARGKHSLIGHLPSPFELSADGVIQLRAQSHTFWTDEHVRPAAEIERGVDEWTRMFVR